MTAALIDARYGALQVSRVAYHASAALAALDLDLPADGALREASVQTRSG